MTTYTAPPDQYLLVLNAGDTLIVDAGGKANDTTINPQAFEQVESGGTSNHTMIFGTATTTGYLEVEVGGTANTTQINSGGLQGVFGTANDTTINSGGTENVVRLGTANDTTINGGGRQDVAGTATSNDTTINNGGVEVVFGGHAHNTTINSGGVEKVLSGAEADGVIFGQPNATLDLFTPSGLTGTIENWQAGDVIDFLNTNVTSVHLTGNTLSVTYGTQTANYTLSGQQPGTEFKLQSDGHGGTELTLVPATGAEPPLVGIHHHEFTGAEPPIVGVQHHETAFIHFGHCLY
jgi:autotransporter passenger strand-loop-strand repeat protein